MELTIRPKNFKLSDSIESQIRKRVERLPRYLDNLQSAEVLLSQQPTRMNPQRFQYVAQLTLQTRNNLIRSEVTDPELLTAVDQAMDRLSRQIERYKARHYRKHKGSPGVGKSSAELANAGSLNAMELAEIDDMSDTSRTKSPAANAAFEQENGVGGIVKVKRFSVKPMFPDEAVEQMELLDHKFFVFYNAVDERISVLYRRNDGDYGLLEPELS